MPVPGARIDPDHLLPAGAERQGDSFAGTGEADVVLFMRNTVIPSGWVLNNVITPQ